MSGNMFTFPNGWEKVVYCKDCKRSYTPIHVPADDRPVIVARFCGITNRIVDEEDYCSRGVEVASDVLMRPKRGGRSC